MAPHPNARTCPNCRAVMIRMVLDHRRPISEVAATFGVSRGTLHRWLRRHRSRGLFDFIRAHNREAAHRTKPEIWIVPLPTRAQFLNVIESLFSGMARAIVHNSDYASPQAAREAIDQYFAERNDHFRRHPRRAGNRIWGKERVPSAFAEHNNCKDPEY